MLNKRRNSHVQRLFHLLLAIVLSMSFPITLLANDANANELTLNEFTLIDEISIFAVDETANEFLMISESSSEEVESSYILYGQLRLYQSGESIVVSSVAVSGFSVVEINGGVRAWNDAMVVLGVPTFTFIHYTGGSWKTETKGIPGWTSAKIDWVSVRVNGTMVSFGSAPGILYKNAHTINNPMEWEIADQNR